MNKPKILFIYDHKYPDKWMDGLWAALNVLEEDFAIEKYNLSFPSQYMFPSRHYDFVLSWGGFNSSVDQKIQSLHLKYKKGFCIAGNTFPATGMNNYDILFYETDWVRNYLELNLHKNIVKAFGVNTDLFCKGIEGAPLTSVQVKNLYFATPVVWDYIGVGSFASWKRWDRVKGKKGMRLVIGEYQEGNLEESGSIAQDLLRNGIMVSPMISPIDLVNFYSWSRICYIPADINGGGERAVMEAKAMGLQVEIEDDNPKLKEVLESPILSHYDYARKLKEGILSVL